LLSDKKVAQNPKVAEKLPSRIWIGLTGVVAAVSRIHVQIFLQRAYKPKSATVVRAGSYFDISISTSINISIRKISKIRVSRGYIT